MSEAVESPIAKENIPSVWPNALDDLDGLPNDTPWPNLGNDRLESWKWLLLHRKLLIRCVTWNLCGNVPSDIESIRKKLIPLNKYHVIFVGTEECERSIEASALNPSKKEWEKVLKEVVGDEYVPLRSHTLQAIHLISFAHKSIIPFLDVTIWSSAIPTGMANTLGNKGGVGMYVKFAETSIFIVNSHFAAHQNAVLERNANFHKISNELGYRLSKQGVSDVLNGSTSINDAADVVVFMGDLNYRINGNRNMVDALISNNMHEVLYHNDQLRINLVNGKVFDGFTEPPLHFKPTYKLDINSDAYDSGSKKRIPAWADRILFVSPNLTKLVEEDTGDVANLDVIVEAVAVPSLPVADSAVGENERNDEDDGEENAEGVNAQLIQQPEEQVNDFTAEKECERLLPDSPISKNDKDIVLHKNKYLECLAYNADFDLRISDHRPVYATFYSDFILSDREFRMLESLVDIPAPTPRRIKKVVETAKPDGRSSIEFSSESQVCSIM